MKATLAAAVVLKDFPADTVDPGFTFIVTGTLADGTSFSTSANAADSFFEFDLPAGVFTGTVNKLGFASLPSVSLTLTAPATVSIAVPDSGQEALFSLPTT